MKKLAISTLCSCAFGAYALFNSALPVSPEQEAAFKAETCNDYASYMNHHFKKRAVNASLVTEYKTIADRCDVTMVSNGNSTLVAAFSDKDYLSPHSNEAISEDSYTTRIQAALTGANLANMGQDLPMIQRHSIAANYIAMEHGTLSPANFPWTYDNMGSF